MKIPYPIKVNLFRLTFLVLAMSGWVLYETQLEDYTLLITIILIFGCIFTVSTAEMLGNTLLIRKNYCWGIFPLKKHLPLDKIQSIHPKDYSIQSYGDLDSGSGNIFVNIFFEFTKPKVKWVVSKIVYLDKEKTKTIEAKVTDTIFMQIENSILAQNQINQTAQ